MKPITKLLPALGLVLGATLAMAMNFASPSNFDASLKVWTPDSNPMHAVTNGYREITNEEIGSDYLCNTTSQVCSVQFLDDDPFGTISQQTPGIYVPQ